MCGPRVAGTLIALIACLAIVTAPVLSAEPAVYRSPYLPDDLPTREQVAGTVVLSVGVYTGNRWTQDMLVVVPAESMAAECVSLPRPKA
jgi:hypothetical protein